MSSQVVALSPYARKNEEERIGYSSLLGNGQTEHNSDRAGTTIRKKVFS
jgi:hypothetical protein